MMHLIKSFNVDVNEDNIFFVCLHVFQALPHSGQENVEYKDHKQFTALQDPVCHSHGVCDPFLIPLKQQNQTLCQDVFCQV